MGQSFKDVKDPHGNIIKISEDSSYLFQAFDYLVGYTINQDDGLRNILFFNGDTSYWLFNQGFSKFLDYSPFTRTEIFGNPGSKIWFRAGDVWYQTQGTQATTTVFNDNNNPAKQYRFLQMFNFKTGDLGIEAIEKNSGDTLTLIYKPSNNMFTEFKDEFGIRIKVIQVTERFGTNDSKDFIGALYNSTSHQYDFYGVYSWIPGSLNQILDLGKRPKYDLKFIFKDYIVYQYIVDRITESNSKVYEYNTASGNFDDVTSTVIDGYVPVDAFNLPTVYYDGALGDTHSFTESIWRCEALPFGGVRYFIRSAFEDDVRIGSLDGQPNANFMYESVNDDSIYYYNYSLVQRGLTRFNTKTALNKFDPTMIQFSQDYKIRGSKAKMYFGRYDPVVGKIVAAYKDFDNASYSFIESSTGDKVENPIDYSFLGKKVFIHSKQADGVKLVYFDTKPVVATHDLYGNQFRILISPNPGKGDIYVSINKDNQTILPFQEYSIYDVNGRLILRGKFNNHDFTFNMDNQLPGLYYLTFLNNGKVITKSFSIE